jgi:hypothetical protein
MLLLTPRGEDKAESRRGSVPSSDAGEVAGPRVAWASLLRAPLRPEWAPPPENKIVASCSLPATDCPHETQ